MEPLIHTDLHKFGGSPLVPKSVLCRTAARLTLPVVALFRRRGSASSLLDSSF